MGSALKNTYDYFENIKGKKLLYLFIFVLTVSLVLGIFAGQAPSFFSKPPPAGSSSDKKIETLDVVEKTGRVVYVNPDLYQNENISYKLVDDKGNDLFLLKASDDKLKIVENSEVKVRGRINFTTDGSKQVLFVEEVVFN